MACARRTSGSTPCISIRCYEPPRIGSRPLLAEPCLLSTKNTALRRPLLGMRLCSAIDRYLVNLARHRIGRSFEAVLFQQFHCVINRSILVSLYRKKYGNNVTPPETFGMNFDRYGKNLNSRTNFSALFWVNSPTHKYGHCLTEGLR